jgi:hypothetical protein
MNKLLKIAFACSVVLLFVTISFFFGCNRTSPEKFKNCVIVKQHCGFDNLDGGFYQVKDLKTNKVYRVDVDIRDCDVYNVGDTIK